MHGQNKEVWLAKSELCHMNWERVLNYLRLSRGHGRRPFTVFFSCPLNQLFVPYVPFYLQWQRKNCFGLSHENWFIMAFMNTTTLYFVLVLKGSSCLVFDHSRFRVLASYLIKRGGGCLQHTGLCWSSPVVLSFCFPPSRHFNSFFNQDLICL